MYKYETHLHTYPVSKCGVATVREQLEFYKKLEYDGDFITNHFIDGNINIDFEESYQKKINFYFSDYEEALELGKEIGIKVFCGVEVSYKGTDFLIYGLDKEWYLNHPSITEMKKSEELEFFMQNGALVIQAHPYREARYIDHIRLFPRCVHGVEILNANRNEFENEMAKLYSKQYGLIEFAGSDNHQGEKQKYLAGMCSEHPISNEKDFVESVKNGRMYIFDLHL
ncbi:MAG: histidinol-phosphatase [Clostridia bacterium]|nr:histidinol-phosphatase [Clostridia bacterium]